jgi:hypothetical protein
MPRLPFERADLLLVDEIGKDVSGTGFDVNVVGRKQSMHAHETDTSAPVEVRHVAVRGLTPATAGNANGIGLAELCRSDVLEAVDWDATRTNALTAGDLPAAMRPIDLPTDRGIVEASLALAGLAEPVDARLMWVRDTLHLSPMAASVAYLPLVRDRDDLEVLADPRPLPFDQHGNLPRRVDEIEW